MLSWSGPPWLSGAEGFVCRYEVEKALFNGSLAVADVPKVWNQKMEAYLGVTAPDDAQGYLQACSQ